MTEARAEAFSRILSEIVTRADLKAKLCTLKARLTWRMIAIVGFFATAVALLNRFLV